MSVFKGVARPAILAAGRSDRLRHALEQVSLTREVVHRFVPGEHVADALDSVVHLTNSHRFVSIDYLGEDVHDPDSAELTVTAYLGLLGALGHQSCDAPRPLEVSLKLSALGQALPREGEKIALENAHTICTKARDLGIWVTVDAEDHTTTDSTLSIVRELRADFDWLGTVLQAYLKRTLGDCQDLAGTRIRLCKGAYDEPASVAFRDRDDVTANYLRCLRVLMAGAGYPMVASHDPEIIGAVPALVSEFSRGVDDFEYQMLYGIRDDEQRRLALAGNHVRVYVPFGSQWYGYFVRRLAERPANLAFFLRALAGH
ncbi:proline dehydrogenase [Mycobacterium sp. CBMA293]|uniref:proline dehydrogenase family protein n=1 Tax=unclassified Mycolicibacterium TaxID=2636767 RepID=UPI0012DE22C9|nr:MULTISPECIES: proline dehydrogenase family protein [unclassified Mycolicibacterium]MUL45921.1 proline dehydrogenase [Mycolicibacterium sp. CBMA 360]MUL60593.1 proline dehydrogenase [Mycolicibacterium sp. CBMA 335]MUL72408.1 proline dehydrogenase [Mycolicibacterium sp. CBMA 311]MUL95191.1 proline dehydrogenase [Mycolicibacterium sp. CBMA 230]MUM06989.1 proline dehydrogenase [Mycolicibacterium sp. CBMA 213]